MKTKSNDILIQNKVFIWIALATALILLIPFLAMQFPVRLPDPESSMEEISWTLFDFMTMGVLLFGTSSMFVLIARRVNKKYRVAIGFALLAAFFLVWIELAVGIFGTPFAGS